jgi:hypothetical protein
MLLTSSNESNNDDKGAEEQDSLVRHADHPEINKKLT